MKLFVAVEIPQKAVKQIQKQAEPIIKDYPAFNWVPSNNYHISLFYIGDAPAENVEAIGQHIRDALYDVTATQAYTFGVGMFINEQITLYVSFHRNKILEEINERIYNLVDPEKRKKNKFILHAAIARWKIPSKQQYFHLKTKLSKITLDVSFAVEEIHLYESIARQKNPEYRKLVSIPLLKE